MHSLLVIITLLCVAGMVMGVEDQAEQTTHDSVRLTLHGLLPDDRDVQLYLRADGPGNGKDGQIGTAFALAPRFNRMPVEVDIASMAASGTGSYTLRFPSDGWVPKPGTFLEVQLTIEQQTALTYTAQAQLRDQQGKALGDPATSKGAVSRTVMEPIKGAQVLELSCQDAVNPAEGKRGKRRLGLELGLQDGRVQVVRAVPPGSLTDIAFTMLAPAWDLAITNGRLQGSLELVQRRQGAMDKSLRARWQLDVPVIGDRCVGQVAVVHADQADKAVTASVLGSFRPAPAKPGDASYTMTLDSALPDGNMVQLRLACRAGEATHAIVTTPNYNNAIHRVDALQVTVREGTLQGQIKLSILPDPWIPADRSVWQAEYTIAADIRAGMAQGTFHGKVKEQAVEGVMVGSVQDRLPMAGCKKLTVKLEDALSGPSMYHNRAFVTLFFAEDGTWQRGKVWNNHSKLRGTVTAATVRYAGDAVTIALQLDIAAGGNTKTGAYSFSVSGRRIGTLMAGDFTGRHREAAKDTIGTYWAAFSP